MFQSSDKNINTIRYLILFNQNTHLLRQNTYNWYIKKKKNIRNQNKS